MKKQPHAPTEETLLKAADGLTTPPDADTALSLLTQLSVSPSNQIRIQALEDRAKRQMAPLWHFWMMNDPIRNQSFQTAIDELRITGKSVLEIGTGAGLLAMMVARQNPARLITCEASAALSNVAAETFLLNGFHNQIDLRNQRSDTLVLSDPERVDIIMAEIVDSALLGEGILPSVRDARERLLKPGGQICPKRGRIYAVPFESQLLHRKYFAHSTHEFDLSPVNRLASLGMQALLLDETPYVFLSAPIMLCEIDFEKDNLEPFSGSKAVTFHSTGTMHGFVMWFEIDLTDRVTLSNSPLLPTTHWGQAVRLLPEPRPVTAASNGTIAYDITDDGALPRLE